MLATSNPPYATKIPFYHLDQHSIAQDTGQFSSIVFPQLLQLLLYLVKRNHSRLRLQGHAIVLPNHQPPLSDPRFKNRSKPITKPTPASSFLES